MAKYLNNLRNCVQAVKNFANGLVAELAGNTVAAIEELDAKVDSIEQYKIEPSVSAVSIKNSTANPTSITFSFFKKSGNADFVACNDGTDGLYATLWVFSGGWSKVPTTITQSTYTVTCQTTIDYLKCVLYKDTTVLAESVIPFVSDASDGEDSTSYKMLVNAASIAKTESGTYKQSTITLQGRRQTGSGAFGSYACRFKIETTTSTNLSSATWTSRYTSGSNTSSYTYTLPSGITGIRCSMYLAGGTSTLLDQVIIPAVSDGATGADGKDGGSKILFIKKSDCEVAYKMQDRFVPNTLDALALDGETIQLRYAITSETYKKYLLCIMDDTYEGTLFAMGKFYSGTQESYSDSSGYTKTGWRIKTVFGTSITF